MVGQVFPQAPQGSVNDDAISALKAIGVAITQLADQFNGLQDQIGTIGTFTFPAAASVIVPNVNVKTGSLIFLEAQNALAATQVSTAISPFIDPANYVPGVSFTVETANGGAATAGAIFSYRIVNVI